MFRHEVNALRGDELGGHDQVALVFPIGIIHDNNHPALQDIGDYRFDGIKLLRHRLRPNYWSTGQTPTRFTVRKPLVWRLTVRFRSSAFGSRRLELESS